MLSIHLKPAESSPKTYAQIITHLATHTLIGHGDPSALQAGKNAQALDISQVCCYMCEKPLNNGMELCVKDNGSGKLNFWKNPIAPDDKEGETEGEDSMKMEEEESENSSSEPMQEEQNHSLLQSGNDTNDINNYVLLCGDCAHGLQESLQDGHYLEKNIIYEKDPANGNSINAAHPSNFLWPNQAETVNLVSKIGANYKKTYSPDQFFVYVRKMSVVEYGTAGEVDEEDIMVKAEVPFEASRAELVLWVFVEPNPNLPTELWYKALNTIRLFRLNGVNYQAGGDFHHLRYRTDKAQTKYDDMRLEGRNKAYDRANTALSQFKTVRSLNAGPEVEKMILSQQQVLMELNGYRSVWRTVFKEGGDEGGFSQIINLPTPVPVNPFVPTGVAIENEESLEGEKGKIIDVGDHEAMSEELNNEATNAYSDLSVTEEDIPQIEPSDISQILDDFDDDEGYEQVTLGLKRFGEELSEKLVDGIVESLHNSKNEKPNKEKKREIKARLKKNIYVHDNTKKEGEES